MGRGGRYGQERGKRSQVGTDKKKRASGQVKSDGEGKGGEDKEWTREEKQEREKRIQTRKKGEDKVRAGKREKGIGKGMNERGRGEERGVNTEQKKGIRSRHDKCREEEQGMG